MKLRFLIEILLTLSLAATMLYGVPVIGPSPEPIKIGLIGPVGLPHWSPAGMAEGAELAVEEINSAGGVNVGGVMRNITLVYGNEYAVPTPDPIAAEGEIVRLITEEGVEFIIGGFRTEVTGPMIDKAMEYGVPFFIIGASTNELITDRVPVNYDVNKYLFRVNPVNSTILFKTIAGSLAYYLIPNQLLPIYGHYLWPGAPNPQVRVAVLTEDLTWTLTMHEYLTNPAIYPAILGPYANVTYSARIDPTLVDLTSYLTDVVDSQARLIIHVFSGLEGVPFVVQWRDMEVNATLVGINVMAQLQSHWPTTGGKCEYEAFLDFAGTRTPIVPGLTEVFWDNFLAHTLEKHGASYWPIYTAWGAYDAMYVLKEAIEAAGTTNPDNLVPVLEATERTNLAGKFKFTQWHDVTTLSVGPIWPDGYVRAMFVQWQAGEKEVVSPVDQLYSKRWKLPPWMYPLVTDINYDGKVNIMDLTIAAKAFGSYPGHEKWDKEVDLNNDEKVNIMDLTTIAKDFGEVVNLPLP